MAAFLRKGHPLSRRQVAARELADCEVIGFAGDELGHRQSAQYFGNMNLKPPRTVLKSSTLKILLTAVAKSDTLALLSDLLEQRAAVAGLQRLKLDQPLWSVNMGICFHCRPWN
jgi:DNA-binding transcriptional LysR family regulator